MMLAESTGGDATTALRRSAILKLEQAAAESVSAGLTWREAKEILGVHYDRAPANTYAAASDLACAALAVDGDTMTDITGGRRGWLVWDLPYLTEPRWHAERPERRTDCLAVEVPEYGSCIGRDPYWARPIVEQAIAEHPDALRHGVDRATREAHDGYPLDWLIELQQQRSIATDREWGRANA